MDVLILHDYIPGDAPPDVLDVMTEVNAVQNALKELGHTSTLLAIQKDLGILKNHLKNNKPDLIFNLVESFNGSGQYAYKIPELIEKLNIPFTGTKSQAMFTTTNKLWTKSILKENGILTPQEILPKSGSDNEFIQPGTYIIKPVWEDASVGVDEDSVVFIANRQDFLTKVSGRDGNVSEDWFVESYIDGREWNVGVLGSELDIEILPPAEIRFNNYDENKPKVLGYQAKWISESFESLNTTRHFNFNPADAELIAQLKSITKHCWSLFDLNGYARVDFRVDNNGVPYVLEINANPCISPDAGMTAAADQIGLNYTSLINKILHTALVG